MVTNVMNDVTTGLTNDFTDLGKIMHNAMNSEPVEPDDKPATYVNQWWYRSTDGRVYNAMAFFNSGSLSADVVLRQLIIVIMACEIVGSMVFHFVCDAGWSFQKVFTYLRQKQDLPDDVVWLPDDYI